MGPTPSLTPNVPLTRPCRPCPHAPTCCTPHAPLPASPRIPPCSPCPPCTNKPHASHATAGGADPCSHRGCGAQAGAAAASQAPSLLQSHSVCAPGGCPSRVLSCATRFHLVPAGSCHMPHHFILCQQGPVLCHVMRSAVVFGEGLADQVHACKRWYGSQCRTGG